MCYEALRRAEICLLSSRAGRWLSPLFFPIEQIWHLVVSVFSGKLFEKCSHNAVSWGLFHVGHTASCVTNLWGGRWSGRTSTWRQVREPSSPSRASSLSSTFVQFLCLYTKLLASCTCLCYLFLRIWASENNCHVFCSDTLIEVAFVCLCVSIFWYILFWAVLLLLSLVEFCHLIK